MPKTLIITSHAEHLTHLHLDFSQFNTIICADGGLLIAEKLGLSPTLLIGDYDSCPCPPSDAVVLPTEKDMTDTEAAIDLAVSRGLTDLTVLGGLGGRLDHTMGNLGMLAKYCGRLQQLVFIDGQNCVFMAAPGQFSVPRTYFSYLGLISYGAAVENLTLRGVRYPLTDHLLPDNTTLGVSNEITADTAKISFTAGRLLVILSRDLPGNG